MAKTFFKELYWLLLLLFVSLLIMIVAFNWYFPSGTIDIHIHDTYYVMPAGWMIGFLFMFFTFLVYFIRTTRQRFGAQLPNILLLLSGILLMALLAYAIRLLGREEVTFSGGWTSYPPLAALGQAAEAVVQYDPTIGAMTNIVTVVLLVVVGVLVYAGFQWGRTTAIHKGK